MKRACFLITLVVLSGLLCGAFGAVHPVGRPRFDDGFARTLLSRSTPNALAALSYDFRSLDTLLTVGCLFASACSIGVLFRDGGRRE